MNHDIANNVVDGFPFENDDVFGKKSDPGIKSHLEDLAKKHPEFAGDLKRPLWGEPIDKNFDKNWDNAFTIPVSVEKGNLPDQPSTSQSRQNETGSHMDTQSEKSNDHQNRENQSDSTNESRDQEPKRFTSKIEITPVNPYEEASSNSASNAQAEPKEKYQPGTPNSGRKQPQVRHIPIFVEGRSEPVVPKNTDDFHPPNQFHDQQIPFKRKFESAAESAPPKQEIPVHIEKPTKTADKQIPVHFEKTKPKPPEPKPAESRPQIQKPDPMSRIVDVQKEVDDLAAQVEKYVGKSRTEKSYLYLDEMLTRELIKLDTIEVEGNDKLRVARKDVIKSIQNAIALLESKVPLPTSANESQQNDEIKSAEDTNKMEIDEQSQNATENQNSANDGGGETNK